MTAGASRMLGRFWHGLRIPGRGPCFCGECGSRGDRRAQKRRETRAWKRAAQHDVPPR